MGMTNEERILRQARKAGILRPRDLIGKGAARTYLKRLVAKNLLVKVGRGMYTHTSFEPTENHTLVEASKRVPHGVICLLTALRFHEIGTQLPHEIWMAIDVKDWSPKVDFPRTRFVRFSGPARTQGVETHDIEGVQVKIYGPAKTVADCFKYRNKIGLDVALEALRECLRARKTTRDEIHKYAKVCRVENVMRPYMEAIA